MPNYNSIYLEHAGSTLNWLPMDSIELYQHNVKHRLPELKQHGWIDKHFTYQFNSHGFRCGEFTHEPTIMFLGCSFTIGIGLPVEHIWPTILANRLNLRCANLGIGNGSSDTAFRMCDGYIDKINPKIVVFMEPPGVRYELVSDSSIINVNVALKEYKNFFKQWVIDDNNDFFNRRKNTMAIEFLCQERGIKFVLAKSKDLRSLGNSLARDLSHCGTENHRLFAEQLITQIN